MATRNQDQSMKRCAADLRIGDQLIERDGALLPVTSVTKLPRGRVRITCEPFGPSPAPNFECPGKREFVIVPRPEAAATAELYQKIVDGLDALPDDYCDDVRARLPMYLALLQRVPEQAFYVADTGPALTRNAHSNLDHDLGHELERVEAGARYVAERRSTLIPDAYVRWIKTGGAPSPFEIRQRFPELSLPEAQTLAGIQGNLSGPGADGYSRGRARARHVLGLNAKSRNP